MNDEKKSVSKLRSPRKQWFQSQIRTLDARQPWEISVCGDLTERQADLLEKFTDVPRGSKGVVYFDSCGGSVYTGLAIGTLIRLRNLRVTATRSESGELAELPVALRQDFLLNQGLQIAAAKSLNGPRLVGKLGRDVRTTTLQGFVDQGVIEARPEKRWLGLVTLPRWPMLNTAPVNEQNQLMYDAIIGLQPADAKTRALIGLLHCLDVTHKVVPLDNLSRADVRIRAKEIAGKSWITNAVRALVAAQMPG